MALTQMALAALFYASVVLIFRLAGKRLAGQTTTFDLIILISLSVALQQVTLLEGIESTFLFVATVFALHLLTALLCARSVVLRHLVRGKPRNLIDEGEIQYSALRAENLTMEELMAGLRKAGIDSVEKVKSAHLEETGQISAIPRSTPATPASAFQS